MDKNYKKKIDKEYKEYKLRQEKNPILATAVNLVHHRNYDPTKTDKQNQTTFYYTRAKEINDEMISKLKEFVDNNLAINPNLKFVLHCRAGKSRSAAVGIYLAKKIGQYTEDFLSEYGDQIKMPRMKDNGKRSNKYPHQNVLNGLSSKEGWDNDKKKPAAERWWYPEMINYLEKNGK
jgi:protein-tyrosine phosphatase